MSASRRIVATVMSVLGMAAIGLSMAGPAAAYPATSGGVTVSTTSPDAGANMTASVHTTPGAVVDFTLHTQTWVLGESTADASGVASLSFTLPAGVTGCHTIVAALQSGGAVVASTPISIGGSCSADGIFTPASTAGGSGNASGGSGSGGLAYTGVAVLGISGLGLALLVGGGLMLMAGKRRKANV